MSGTTGASDDDLEARCFCPLCEGIEPFRRPVCGYDLGLVSDLEAIQGLCGMLHGRPVRLATHDDCNWPCRHSFSLDSNPLGPQEARIIGTRVLLTSYL